MRILAIIPAFNEETGLGRLLDRLLALDIFSPQDVFVIDDGSTDKTYQIAIERGVRAVRHSSNKGKGEALKTGFRLALREKYDAVITLDADLQHPPEKVRELLSAINDKWDIVVGSRFENLEGMPFLNYLSNRLTTLVLSLVAGKKLEDTQSGFRAFRACVLSKLKLKANHFDLESEFLARAARMGFKIGVVPIRTIYGEERSHVNKLYDTLRFIKLVFLLEWR